MNVSLGNIAARTLNQSPQATTPSTAAPKFAAKFEMTQPDTVEKSRFTNQRIPLRAENMVEDLLAKLDECMTVAGETYSGKEAFTSLIDLKFHNGAWAKPAGPVNASVKTQVDNTLNVGRAQNVGIMVLSSEAKNYTNDAPIATARASFNAIEPESVHSKLDDNKLVDLLERVVNGIKNGRRTIEVRENLDKALDALRPPAAMKTAPVQALDLKPEDAAASQQAGDWNQKLSGFYRGLATRLGARDNSVALENLASLPESPTSLVNSNVYVTPDMLNKKQTGHGGIAAAFAVRDMLALAEKFNGTEVQLERVTANYVAPFHVTDALQIDTTIDGREDGTYLLSSRISKLDTKTRRAEGPIILVNAKVKTANGGTIPVLSSNPAAQIRRNEARQWAQAVG